MYFQRVLGLSLILIANLCAGMARAACPVITIQMNGSQLVADPPVAPTPTTACSNGQTLHWHSTAGNLTVKMDVDNSEEFPGMSCSGADCEVMIPAKLHNGKALPFYYEASAAGQTTQGAVRAESNACNTDLCIDLVVNTTDVTATPPAPWAGVGWNIRWKTTPATAQANKVHFVDPNTVGSNKPDNVYAVGTQPTCTGNHCEWVVNAKKGYRYSYDAEVLDGTVSKKADPEVVIPGTGVMKGHGFHHKLLKE